MSKLFVDQVDPKTATTLTLGTSGDTISIPSGVTIANAGTATGFDVCGTNLFRATMSGSQKHYLTQMYLMQMEYLIQVIIVL